MNVASSIHIYVTRTELGGKLICGSLVELAEDPLYLQKTTKTRIVLELYF